MRTPLVAITLAAFLCRGTTSFSVEAPRNLPISDKRPSVTRRGFVSAAAAAAAALFLTEAPCSADETTPDGVTLFTSPSGLKYIELKEGTGKSPRYGQLLTISYTAYVKLPNKDKQKFDSNIFLLKHGNGRTVAGLDEGLHTMKKGGVRRLIVPPKLGYVDIGLGPLPSMPWNRWRLNQLLDQMVEVKGGNLIFDVELKGILDDEADQGYYEDRSLTPEEFDTLRNNLQQKAAKAAAAGAALPETV